MNDSGKPNKDSIKELEVERDRLEAQLREKMKALNLEIALRLKLESDLHDCEERYRSIFDNSLDGILLTAPDGSIYAANRAVCEMLGRTEQEICEGGRKIILDENDSRLESVLVERMRDGKFLGELYHKRKDGSVFPAEFSSTLFRLTSGELRTSVILRDVTIRKQTEQVLKDSEERLQLALKGADLGMWDWNIVTGELVLNNRWAEMLGYSLNEIKPHVHSWEELVHPDDLSRSLEAVKAHLEGKTAYYESEHRLRSKSGEWIWVLDKGKVTHRDENGNPLRAVGTHLDITGRKRAEAALKDSEEKYRKIFENELIAIFFFDRETLRFLDVNDTCVRLYGYSREELLNGMTLLDISAEADASMQSVQKAGLDATIHVPVRYHKKKNGSVFPIELFGGSFSLNGRPVKFGMARDISNRIKREDALQKSEERLNLALKATQDAVWDWDLVAHTLYYSPRWWDMLGYEPNEAYLDPDCWRQYVHPDDIDRATQIVTNALVDQDSYEVEFRLRHKDGHYVPVLVRGAILRDENHKAIRVSGANADLTEKKRIEEERNQWERHKQQFQKAESLSRMAAAIAHNFNNLLGSVIGSLDLAKDDLPKDARLRANIEEALRSSQLAAEVSGLMLTYLGKTVAKLEPLNLTAVCQGILPVLRRSIGSQITLESELPSASLSVQANASQIQQILKSLVANASEAIGNERGNIQVKLDTLPAPQIPVGHCYPIDWQPQEQHYACIEVKDTGCGVSDKDIERIFDPFYSTKFAGRGLGLSVVLGIVRAHQGGIAVESAPGQGCAIKVFLPISSSPIFFPEEKEIPAEIVQGANTVLLVDDDEPMRRMTSRMLARMGFAVLEAMDGIEAIENFKRHQKKIRFVILDLTMPRMDGWEALSELRKIRPGVPIVLVSGYDEARVMQGDHPELPQAFLHKPYRKEELKEALDTLQNPAQKF